MDPGMAHTTLTRTFELLRASLRGQLVVLAFNAVMCGLVLLAVDGTYVPLAMLLALLVATSLAARTATRGQAGYDTLASDLPGDLLQLVPRLLAQSLLVGVPAVLVWSLALVIAGPAPMVGLGLVLLLVPASVLLLAPQLLVIGGIASGDRSWTPRHALTMSLHRDRILRTQLIALAGIVVAMLPGLPLALLAMVLATQLGPAAPIAFGLALVAPTPILGCGTAAAWKVLGGDELLRGESARHETGSTGADAFGRAAPPRPGAPAPVDDPRDAAHEVTWAEGAAWDVALDAGAAWGTWIRLPAAVRAGIQVRWHSGAPPEVSLAAADGTWRRPGELPATGEPLVVDLAEGDTYLQLTSRANVPQAISATLLVPGHAAA